MITAARAIVLLGLLSTSRAAPVACEDLVRPLDRLDPGGLGGRWALVAGSLSHPPFLERFKQRDSAAVNFSRNTSDTNVSYTRSIRLENQCQYDSYNITLEGSTFSFDGTHQSNLTAAFIRTPCSDCLLMHMRVKSGEREHFYLFSRRRQLQQSEMEEFRAQVACLNLPPPAVMDPNKELCPEETDRGDVDPAADAEDKRETQGD